MNPFFQRLFVLIIVFGPGIVYGQAPSDDCISGPVTEIATLPFANLGTMNFNNDVDFGFDLGATCVAGGGGTPTAEGGDFVYQITLGYGHNVDCTFTSNTSDWVFVFSNNCQTPLAAGACSWGEVVPSLSSGSFNTAALALVPGTYYLWFDRALCCPIWEILCTGDLIDAIIYNDGFETGNTDNWSGTVPVP